MLIISLSLSLSLFRNKFVVLHNNANYTQTVEVLRKSLREKANNGESGDNGSGSHDSHESSSKFSPPSPDNEDSQEDTHGAKRKRGKTGSFNNFVFEDSQQPPQKVVSLDPLSEISLSMAILARSSLDRYSEPQLQHATPKVDCKNNIHQYFVSPNNSFIYCRACGNVIKL